MLEIPEQQQAIDGETLTGEDEEQYVRRVLAIIRAGRLNSNYPDGRRLSGHIRAMSPEVHRGEYDGLEVNVESGLPTYREFTRVQTDVSIAADQLAKLGDRSRLARRAEETGHEVHRRQLHKYDYYDAIADTRLAPLGAMDVELKRVEPANNKAYFYVVFDKLDASGIFVRYTIELSQQSNAWSERVVEIDEENSRHTEEFQSLIYKFSSMDAEFTYAKLETLPGVSVRRVTRGTVGPFYFGRWEVPKPFDDIVGDDPDQFVAMFALDDASDEVEEHRNNDPVGELFENELSSNMRATYRTAREKFDYHVYRDRKFVVSRSLREAVQQLCEDRGTRNIVYAV